MLSSRAFTESSSSFSTITSAIRASIFTPIERVNINIENTRVGQITDFDKLTLDVYTNGTLDPDEAVGNDLIFVDDLKIRVTFDVRCSDNTLAISINVHGFCLDTVQLWVIL